MSIIYFYTTQNDSPGINKILSTLVNKLKSVNIKSDIVNDIDILDKQQIIIPYGIKDAFYMLQRKYPLNYCIMADAYTIGWLKKISFYIKRFKFNYYDLYYSMFQVLKYGYKEFNVVKHAKRIMYVSPYDINKLMNIYPSKKFILIQNGVSINSEYIINSDFNNVNPNHEIVLGSISNWNKTSRDEIRWFIDDYFSKIHKSNPKIKLLLAGYCSDESLIDYFKSINGVEFLGAVKDLGDFFKRINIFIATLPKGVGILNKVLDAFAYKKLVIGLPECFNAFPNNKNGFVKFSNYEGFLSAIDTYVNNKNAVSKMIEISYNYIKNYHDWDENYNVLIYDILDFYKIPK